MPSTLGLPAQLNRGTGCDTYCSQGSSVRSSLRVAGWGGPVPRLSCPQTSSAPSSGPSTVPGGPDTARCVLRAAQRTPATRWPAWGEPATGLLVDSSAGEQEQRRCRPDPRGHALGTVPSGPPSACPKEGHGTVCRAPAPKLSSLHHTPEGLGPHGPQEATQDSGGSDQEGTIPHARTERATGDDVQHGTDRARVTVTNRESMDDTGGPQSRGRPGASALHLSPRREPRPPSSPAASRTPGHGHRLCGHPLCRGQAAAAAPRSRGSSP